MDFSTADYETRWRQGVILICESFGDLFTFAHFLELIFLSRDKNMKQRKKAELEQSRPLIIDEMVVEADTFACKRFPTLLLMLHSQIFIETNFILGGLAERSFAELRVVSFRMQAALQARSRVKSVDKPTSWPPANEKVVSQFCVEAQLWSADDDPVTMVRRHVTRSSRNAAEVQPTSLLMQRDLYFAA